VYGSGPPHSWLMLETSSKMPPSIHSLLSPSVGQQAHALRAGFAQGLAMAGVGAGAIVQIVLRILRGGAPSPSLMGSVAALALIVNGYCAYRLIRFRSGDASMRALWLSTRNDAMLNVLAVVAAVFIAITESGWPDTIAGAIIATVNLVGSVEVVSAAIREIRKTA
jgi:Co/Zn/Cd efflux system component